MGKGSYIAKAVDALLSRWRTLGDHSIKRIFLAALSGLFVVSLGTFMVFDVHSQRQQSEAALLEEARVFALEMDAIWDFIDNSQYLINYTSDGTYEFKGLYCSLVGKSVGKLFSGSSKYTIRYTNFEPRNVQDIPDGFEEEALTYFNAMPEREYYGLEEFGGKEAFRYVRAQQVKDSCLECHGEPAGELDITGHAKEGWTKDSVGGAVSIVVPVDQQMAAMRSNVIRDAVFFSLQGVVLGAVLYLLVHVFVFRPLDRVKEGFNEVRRGEVGAVIEPGGAARELADHIGRFNEMTAELKQSYDGLEEQVALRTRDLQEANEQLAQQKDSLEDLSSQLADEVRYKSDLLSTVNHELRTPLTSIIATSQVSLEVYDPATERERAAWKTVQRNGTVLLGIINNMLDVAKAEAGSISALEDPMDLGDIVHSVIKGMRPLAAASEVGLTSRVGADVPLVMGDFEKTQRICENLVGNAIKFTPDGGCVSLAVRRDGVSGDVLVEVSDSGIGIAPEDQRRIFDRFVQIDSASTRRYPGSGLGLALVKGYADIQGFAISVESEEGAGSTFTVRIPARAVID